MSPLVIGTPRLDASDQPAEGAWTTPVRVTGCGPTTRLNVLTLIQPGRDPRRVGLLPGTTVADPTLQIDAVRLAFPYARQVLGRCEGAPTVLNTPFRGPAGEAVAPGAARPWSETWTVRGCGRTADVPMTFIPTSRGTSIAAGGAGR